MNEDSFQVTKGFKGYVAKAEVTELDPSFLVKGSKNVLVDYASRVISRNGYQLFGAANTGGTGIKGSYEWDTSTAKQFPIRSWGGNWEFYWNNTWNLLKSGLATSYAEWAKVWDDNEKIDVLLGVIADTNMYKWSGGATKVASSTGSTLTKQGVLAAKTTIAFVVGNGTTVNPTITDSANGFVIAGFAAGDTLYVSGSVSNNRNFTIASVAAGVITLIMSDVLITEAAGSSVTVHNGEPTWASSRFLLAASPRSIIYNGVPYTYTGGETTATLTGLTAFPAVTPGDAVWQALITISLPNPIPATFKPDLIAVQLNQVILASTKYQDMFISSAIDYTDFTLTSPRAPADPAKVTPDNYPTCLIPLDNESQTSSSLMIGAGHDAFFQLAYYLSQDQTAELVRVVKLHTAAMSGLLSKDAICPVKRGTVYISREPALDSLGSIEAPDTKRNTPLSDPIKTDFDQYDFTDAHVRYYRRSIYITVPKEGIVLIYDMMRGLWQPPQTMPISRLAIIDDELCGHSSITNETYKLFVGTNDNGQNIQQVARFAYNNGGRRDRLKNQSEMWSDGYITANAILNMKNYCGFDGQSGVAMMVINGGDTSITTQQNDTPTGTEPFGNVPFGGESLDDSTGLPGAGVPLLRFWQIDTVTANDYIEMFTEYTLDTLDAQFAIVAHGTDQCDAGTSPVSHKK